MDVRAALHHAILSVYNAVSSVSALRSWLTWGWKPEMIWSIVAPVVDEPRVNLPIDAVKKMKNNGRQRNSTFLFQSFACSQDMFGFMACTPWSHSLSRIDSCYLICNPSFACNNVMLHRERGLIWFLWDTTWSNENGYRYYRYHYAKVGDALSRVTSYMMVRGEIEDKDP